MSQYFARWRDGYQVSWRNLTLAEYNSFKDLYDSSPFLNPLDIALDIYQIVRLSGPLPNVVPAGIPAYICKQQMANNPFSGTYHDISEALALARRAVQGNFLLSAKGVIASILHYRLEEIDNWDPTTFFVRLAQAEIASGRTFEPVNPRAVKDPKHPERKQPVPTPIQQKAIDRVKERNRAG